MAEARVWVMVRAGAVFDTVNGLLSALGLGFQDSLQGQFPLGAPQVLYGGWQGPLSLITLVEATLAGVVVGCRVARGPVYGLESDDSPGVVQEADIGQLTPFNPLAKHTRRAVIKRLYLDSLLGNPPADVTSPAVK